MVYVLVGPDPDPRNANCIQNELLVRDICIRNELFVSVDYTLSYRDAAAPLVDQLSVAQCLLVIDCCHRCPLMTGAQIEKSFLIFVQKEKIHPISNTRPRRTF